MNSKIARTIILSVITLALVTSASAGWHNYRFLPRTAIAPGDPATITYGTTLVNFWVNHKGNDSDFTIYCPNVGGLRVYIVVQGVSWQAFQQYTMFGNSAGGSLLMPDGTVIAFGGLDMTKLLAGTANIEVKGKMSGEFTRLYYRQPTISVRVIGQPGQPVGNKPNVTVDIKGSVINVVKVDYPRPAVANLASPGTVSVKQSGTGGRQSLINAVTVRGGMIGACEAVKGITQLIVKGRRYKKTTIVGGYFTTAATTTDGRIEKIFASNGLDGNITAGADMSPNGIRKIIAVRGGDGAKITAGGASATITPIGTIGKICVNLKKYGANTTLNNCKFYSYSQPKVKLNKKNVTFAKIIGCDVITPNGTFPIDATYKNLK